MEHKRSSALPSKDKTILSQMGLAALVLISLFFLWNTHIIYPLKLLTVFFHESSHALMTIATGGTVIDVDINPQQGGHVISRGGNRFLTLSAGYLGSLLWGVAIYLIAVKTRKDKAAMFFLGGVLIVMALLFIRSVFGFFFCLSAGLVMAVLAIRAPDIVNDFILRVIGLASIIYTPLDILSDTIFRSHLKSDARMLAEEFGGFTVMWGGLWIIASIIIIGLTIKWSVNGK